MTSFWSLGDSFWSLKTSFWSLLTPFWTLRELKGGPWRHQGESWDAPGTPWDGLGAPFWSPGDPPKRYPRKTSILDSFWLPKWRQNGCKNDSFLTRFLNQFSKQKNDEKSTSCNLKTIIDSKRMKNRKVEEPHFVSVWAME